MLTSSYVFFNGGCADALQFYEKHLGARIDGITRYGDTPAAQQIPAEYRNRIIHARFSIGGAVIMASDAGPGLYSAPQGFYISLDAGTPAEAERIFKALSEKGVVRTPLAQSFFAARYGQVVDQFGIPWMIVAQVND